MTNRKNGQCVSKPFSKNWRGLRFIYEYIYNAILFPILTYAVETKADTQKTKQKIINEGMKILQLLQA